MDRDPTERCPTDDDKISARIALWMGLTVFLLGLVSYVVVVFGMSDLSEHERDAMKFICAITSFFGAVFIGWKPTHEGDDLD
ncbi:MAG: hypothetical protein AAB480_03935 [Patescibacteria group bacterium]